MKYKVYIILAFMVLGVIISFAHQLKGGAVSKQEDTTVYKIQLTGSIGNNEIINMDYIVFDNYIFEQYISDNTDEYKTISNTTGEIVTDSVHYSKTLNGYYLSSIDGTNTWSFDAEGKFINKIPLTEKITGLNFKEDPSGLKQYANQFKEVGDTIVAGKKRKKIMLTLDFESEKAVYTATLDTSLYGRLALHPLFPELDHKFKGICLSLDIKYIRNNIDFDFKTNFNLLDSLSQSDKDWIAYFRNDFLKKL